MIVVQNTNDFEFFSRTSKGAMQGYGYTFLSQNKYGPRLVRLIKVTNFSVHDLALVDSPAFHLIVDNCSNGEVYNVIIRGANIGGLDGIDSSGTNLWYHDIEVTNKDECITIKSPSSYTKVENIYCNWSGGCAMGSFGTGTAVSKISYKNIYTWQSNQVGNFRRTIDARIEKPRVCRDFQKPLFYSLGWVPEVPINSRLLLLSCMLQC